MKKMPLLLCVLSCFSIMAQTQKASLPRIEHKNDHYAFMVDDQPFLILGAQANNSSTWPSALPKVWSAMEKLHVNTLEIPIYWEQFEPSPGEYDFSVVDAVITQARQHDLKLVLLWFATWKNGSNHYMPQWMKLQPKKYPNMIGKDGKTVDSPSPHAQATLEADKRAFSVFMKHLKEFDKDHTVIIVQVENEPGTWGSVRDFSPEAQKLFGQPVPKEAMKAMGVKTNNTGNWSEVFGKDADEYFHVWHIASYIEEVAKAGKEIYPLPLMVNAAVRDPFDAGWPPNYQVGGPNDNVFGLWKSAAPSIDIIAPDIYTTDTKKYLKLIELYSESGYPLMIPETHWRAPFPRFFYSALGKGAIGYAPFGLDDQRIRFGEDGEALTDEELYGPTARNFKIFENMQREIAQLNFEGKIKTAVQMEPIDKDADPGSPWDRANYITDTTLTFTGWDIDVAFGRFDRLDRTAHQSEHPDGRIMVAELEKGTFLITGYHSRVMVRPSGERPGISWNYLVVEEGHYENGEFVVERILNGDQTDFGLPFNLPKVLRVKLYERE
ncbi:MAG: DUF5597 domain-containing protein [Flavobacteriaceae bacterium]|nr:DUF5597 domain-containing protein [Flavobacteriaceae bacterium]